MRVFPGDNINVPSTSASAVNGIHSTLNSGSISTRSGVLSSSTSKNVDAMDIDGAKKAEKYTVNVAQQRRVSI